MVGAHTLSYMRMYILYSSLNILSVFLLSSFQITEYSTRISATVRQSVELSNKASLLSFLNSLVEL